MRKHFLVIAFILFVSQNLNAQVGIGTTSPNPNAVLELNSTSKGLLLPRITTNQRNALPAIGGMVVFDTDFKEFYYGDGGSWKKLLNNNYALWSYSPTRSWIFNTSDSVGIGTSSPDQKLHLRNGKFYIEDDRADNSPHIIFDNPAVDYKEGGLQWHRSGDTLASLDYVEHPLYPNFLKFTAGNTSSMYFNSAGLLGIGYADPQAKLHLRDGNSPDDVIRIDGINPAIRFMKRAGGPIYTWEEVGFVQTTDNKDLRIGTYSGNTTGKFIIRTDGTDRVHVTGLGMGIGTNLPLTNLHLQGGQDAGLTVNTNGYAMVGSATSNGTNLIIDNNEIMARTGYTSAGTLFLQNEGGNVVIGAKTTINKDGEAIKLNGVNPNIGFYQSGVYRGFISQSGNELFIGVNGGKLHLDATQIAIGAALTTADSYKLSVTGKIICEELKVELSGNWPDYVFSENYNRRNLYELESFIKQNKHLPNIPAAAQIEKEGMEVGDMQKRMMEKVEELTLYIIELKKEIDQLKQVNNNPAEEK